jgi:hypothetical protein
MNPESYHFKVGAFGCIAAKAGVVLRWGVASAFSRPPLPVGSGRWASQRNDE